MHTILWIAGGVVIVLYLIARGMWSNAIGTRAYRIEVGMTDLAQRIQEIGTLIERIDYRLDLVHKDPERHRQDRQDREDPHMRYHEEERRKRGEAGPGN